MHELSLAMEVCRLAEERLAVDDMARLRTVAIEVGADANIEVENFRFCLEALLSTPPFAGAQPALLTGPGSALRLAYLEVEDAGPDH